MLEGLSKKIHLANIDFLIVLGVIGSFIFFLGFALLIPAVIDLIYDEHTWGYFVISAGIAFISGGLLWFFFKPKKELRIREGFLIVSLTWIILSLVGALPFKISGVLPSYTDAVFETMSGLTTTGSSIFGGVTSDGTINPAIETLPKSIVFWRSLSHWLGGMGIIVLSIAILPILGVSGMQLFQAEAPGPTADKLTPRVQETAKLLWGVYTLITLAEFLLLWAHPSMNWFDALNHSFATLATGGFSTKDASIAAYHSVYIDTVITIFMFFAGINFALYYYLIKGEPKRLFVNSEVRFFTVIAVSSIIITALSLWLQTGYSIGDSFRYGSFQSISILTSTGFATDDYVKWPMLAQFTIFLLFFLGGCAGSTSGGIKSIHWLIIFKVVTRQIRQIIHPQAILPIRLGGQVIDQKILNNVISFFIAYLIITFLGAFALSIFGVDILSGLSAALSMMGNIGPGFGTIGPLYNFAHIHYLGKWVLIFLMVIGRLEIFTFLILFSPSYWKK